MYMCTCIMQCNKKRQAQLLIISNLLSMILITISVAVKLLPLSTVRNMPFFFGACNNKKKIIIITHVHA